MVDRRPIRGATELRQTIGPNDAEIPVISTTPFDVDATKRIGDERAFEFVRCSSFGVDQFGWPVMVGCERGLNQEEGGTPPRTWVGGTDVDEVRWTAVDVLTYIPTPTLAMVGRQFVYRDPDGNIFRFNVVTNPAGDPVIDWINRPVLAKVDPGFIGSFDLNNAYGLSADNGNVWASSPLLQTVFKFSAEGVPDGSIPQLYFNAFESYDGQIGTGVAGSGTTPLQLSSPQQIAVNPVTGHVYIADYGNNRLVVANGSTGAFISSVTGLTGITGVWVDSSQRVYVVFGTNVRRYNAALTAIDWTQALGATGVHVTGDNTHAWVTCTNNTVRKYTVAGGFVSAFGSAGSADGQFSTPIGIAVDSLYVYVMDQGNDRIQAFLKSTNAFHRKWGQQGVTPFDFNTGRGIAAHPITGHIFTADNASDWVKEETAFGEFRAYWAPGSGSGVGQLNTPHGVAFNAAGTKAYVSDEGNHRILHYTLIAAAHYPLGIAVDRPTGFVYVADNTNNRVRRFSWNGSQTGFYVTAGQPTAVAVTGSGGKVWVTTQGSGEHKLLRFHETTGALELSIGGAAGAGAGQFSNPMDVTIAPDGSVWVADYDNDRLVHYAADGTFIEALGETGTADGQLNGPIGLAFDDDDRLWVVEALNNRLQAFDQGFNFLGKAGTVGLGVENLNSPAHVAVNSEGTIFVADGTINWRVQRLTLPVKDFVLIVDDPAVDDLMTWTGTNWRNVRRSDAKGLTLLEALPFSGVTFVNLDGLLTDDFDEYDLEWEIDTSSLAANWLGFRVLAGTTPNVTAGAYTWSLHGANYSATHISAGATSSAITTMTICWIGATGVTASWRGAFRIIRPTASRIGQVLGKCHGLRTGLDFAVMDSGAQLPAGAFDGIQLLPTGGTMTGRYALRGIRG